MSEPITIEAEAQPKRTSKAVWQLEQRRRFRQENGFSTATHYRFAGARKAALERDGHKCVMCGMTDEQHRQKWHRPLNLHHKDRNERNNVLDNLETLCYSCHGAIHIPPQLVVSKAAPHRARILRLHSEGVSCNRISKEIGVGCKIITKWIRRWNGGTL